MPPVLKVAAFVAQSVAIGLALAFIAVLFKPALINRAINDGGNQTSYAQAVAASAAAVATIYAERVYNAPSTLRGRPFRGRALGSAISQITHGSSPRAFGCEPRSSARSTPRASSA